MLIGNRSVVACIALGFTMHAGALLVQNQQTPTGTAPQIGQSQRHDNSSSAQTSQTAPDSLTAGCARKDLTAPRVLSAPEPKFPDEAKRTHIQGISIIGLTIDVDGKPQNLHLIKSMADGMSPELVSVAQDLDREALRTAKRYKFQPAKCKGTPVPAEVKVQISFHAW